MSTLTVSIHDCFITLPLTIVYAGPQVAPAQRHDAIERAANALGKALGDPCPTLTVTYPTDTDRWREVIRRFRDLPPDTARRVLHDLGLPAGDLEDLINVAHQGE